MTDADSSKTPLGRPSVRALVMLIIGGAILAEALNFVVLVVILGFFARFSSILEGAAKIDVVHWSLVIIGLRALMSVVSNLALSGSRLRMYSQAGILPTVKPLAGKRGFIISDMINVLESVIASALALGLMGGSPMQVLAVTCISSLSLLLFVHFLIERRSRKKEAIRTRTSAE